MQVKTSELSGIQLDYAVAICLGGIDFHYDTVATYWITIDGKDRALSKSWAQAFAPSTDWSHGGPIIERERIDVFSVRNATNWCAQSDMRVFNGYGHTPLIAAMRCYVASKLGDEVEIPDDLLC
ncbi:MAG: DUF2591 family protein [Rhodocyclaceae bacterium]|nr:DUF2591 family protein [Rhodocyclaceae bacterium]